MALEDDADVFAIPDFWQTSKWLDQVAQESATSLFAADVKGKVKNYPCECDS